MAFRRRFSGRRRSRPPMAWVANSNTYNNGGSDFQLVAGSYNVQELCGAIQPGSDTVDPLNVSRFKVIAVRGEIYLRYNQPIINANPGTPMSLGLGIIVAKASTTGSTNLPDPLLVGDAGEPWLWLYHCRVNDFEWPMLQSPAAPQPDIGTQFHSIRVSTRTRRIIRNNEYLAFVMSTGNGPVDHAYYVLPWLRTLVSKIV